MSIIIFLFFWGGREYGSDKPDGPEGEGQRGKTLFCAFPPNIFGIDFLELLAKFYVLVRFVSPHITTVPGKGHLSPLIFLISTSKPFHCYSF